MNNNQKHLSLNIQRFASDGTNTEVTTAQNVTQNTTQGTSQITTIDYDKIQGMIDSRNSKTEESVLKSYFQSQGLSSDEMKEAISTYKTQKEENNKQQGLDNAKLQSQLQEANLKVLQSQIDNEAFKQTIELGIDTKTIPYLTKMADFTNVTDEKGTIDSEKVKEALNKVLTDVPSLKPSKEEVSGIVVGADTSNSTQNASGGLFNFDFTGIRKRKE